MNPISHPIDSLLITAALSRLPGQFSSNMKSGGYLNSTLYCQAKIPPAIKIIKTTAAIKTLVNFFINFYFKKLKVESIWLKRFCVYSLFWFPTHSSMVRKETTTSGTFISCPLATK